ncbi:CpsD/CapB family tyrosine-protein kinase [Rhodobacter calidifons]|uniref:CpsD/CapB family tyrosine-protein kinase n=1 Tax=Rhodobacter calidifons TaxID=2715277 RepID=A0ABX0G878_9RHOB|nr:CpsD/CapB family tyrosine-protein kinase [Rhodobacter calidifons]NHB77068.1 CpsD/CapB family tyrosine-protein kinase [Rhodobacter calidifons]
MQGAKPGAQHVIERGPWHDLGEVSLDFKRLERNRIVAMHPGQSAASFDLMRTNMSRTLRSNGWTRVAITSPTPGCGKSTIALNLAFSLARMADTRVLLIELDLRHPSLLKIMGLEPGQDFGGMLASGTLDLRQIRRCGPNLAFAASSQPIASPAELLSAPRTADMIDEIETRLRPDVILFDMSPMLVNDDAISFLDQVDCALMIAAADETTVTEVDRCGKDLAKRTQVLGVVLNKCRYPEREGAMAYPE